MAKKIEDLKKFKAEHFRVVSKELSLLFDTANECEFEIADEMFKQFIAAWFMYRRVVLEALAIAAKPQLTVEMIDNMIKHPLYTSAWDETTRVKTLERIRNYLSGDVHYV